MSAHGTPPAIESTLGSPGADFNESPKEAAKRYATELVVDDARGALRLMEYLRGHRLNEYNASSRVSPLCALHKTNFTFGHDTYKLTTEDDLTISVTLSEVPEQPLGFILFVDMLELSLVRSEIKLRHCSLEQAFHFSRLLARAPTAAHISGVFFNNDAFIMRSLAADYTTNITNLSMSVTQTHSLCQSLQQIERILRLQSPAVVVDGWCDNLDSAATVSILSVVLSRIKTATTPMLDDLRALKVLPRREELPVMRPPDKPLPPLPSGA